MSNQEGLKLVGSDVVPVSLVYTTYLALNWLTRRDANGVQATSTVQVVVRREWEATNACQREKQGNFFPYRSGFPSPGLMSSLCLEQILISCVSQLQIT